MDEMHEPQQATIWELAGELEGFPLGEVFSRILPAESTKPEYDSNLIEAVKRFRSIMPFMEMLPNEPFTNKGALKKASTGEILTPVDIYVQERGLQDATPEQQEAHKEDFLAFYAAYLTELEANSDNQDKAQTQLLIWEALREKGFIKGKAEEVIAEAADNALILTEYAAMLHGPGLDALSQLSKRPTIRTHHITGLRSVVSGGLTVQEEQDTDIVQPIVKTSKKAPASDTGIALAFEKLTSRLSSVAAQKLLDICQLKLTKLNTYKAGKPKTLIELPLKEYMELCGIPLTKHSMDYTRRIMKELLEAFYSVSLSWEETKDGKAKERYHLRILQKRSDILNGTVYLQFTEDIAAYLTRAYIMHFPLALLKVDERSPNVYSIGRRLMMQYSNVTNQARNTANIISVRALLEKTPGIPTYDEVMAAPADRHLEMRIMRPFKAALDKLDFIEWEYCNAKYAPLTEEQKANFDYDTFIECYVHFTPLNAPDLMPLVEAKAEQKAKAETAKKARTEARQRKAKGEA